MKAIIYGIRGMAESLNTTRDIIRYMIKKGRIVPSKIKMSGNFCHVFDDECQRKIKKCLTKNKKAGKSQPFYS